MSGASRRLSLGVGLAAAAAMFILLVQGMLAGRGPRQPVVLFLADSLDVAFGRLEGEFESAHPELDLIREPSGSVLASRKLRHGRRCDLLAVADSRVIDDLMPEFAGWRIDFVTNEVVIAGSHMSRGIAEINASNWLQVLLRDDVTFARADPDLDPCGYWTLLCWKLADRHYPARSGEDLPSARLLVKCPPKGRYVREDAHKLLSLVETSGGVDYIFVYRSQATDHRLRVVELPREIHLGDPERAHEYGQVSVDVLGADGKPRQVRGKPIVYSLTIPKDAPEPDAARKVVEYLLGEKGRRILTRSGFPPMAPARMMRMPGTPVPALQGIALEEVRP